MITTLVLMITTLVLMAFINQKRLVIPSVLFEESLDFLE